MEFSENRLKHSLGVAKRMAEIASRSEYTWLFSAEEAFTLGYLHDIGYAFSPKDHAHAGGLFLKTQGYRYWREVYLHGAPLAKQSSMLQLLNFADMTTGPSGERLSVAERLADIGRRHGITSSAYQQAQTLAVLLHHF